MEAPVTGPGSPLRRWRDAAPAVRAGIAGLVAIGLLAGGLAVAVRNHPRAPDPAAELDRIGERLDALNPWEPRSKASDGGKVRVRETGYARLAGSGEKGKIEYSVGVVVENTSRTDAVVPRIVVDARDADGQSVDIRDVNDGVTDQVIPPGARLGFSGTIDVDEPVADEISVSAGASEWYGAREDIGAVTATDVRVRDGGETLRVGFESDYDLTLLMPKFHALFRDRSGKLIGGEDLFSVDAAPIPPGASQHDLELAGLPKDADPDAVEVYVFYDWTVFSF